MNLLPFLGIAGLATCLADELVPLALDDECDSGREECALNALHMKASLKTAALSQKEEEGGIFDWSDIENDGNCGDCMMNNGAGFNGYGSAQGPAILTNPVNCWTGCGRASGNCESFCGKGNACCRYGFPGPAECQGIGFWPSYSFHTCVISSAPPNPEIPTTEKSSTGTTTPPSKLLSFPADQHLDNHYYMPRLGSLRLPSAAPLYTFYVYRAMSDDSFPPENVNAANAAGVMWYLHNEVVVYTPRKFKITRIVRFKVQYKAPQPLYKKGMSFGVRYAFDSGKCTGPGDCSSDFDRYGYFVGCNYVHQYPTAQFTDAVYYPNATWYSFPGPCNDKDYKSHTKTCVRSNPGGACSGTPTGQGDCTYTYEPAGEIRVDEMVGIDDYGKFMTEGGREYVRCRASTILHCDKGVNSHFWNWKKSPRINQWRVDKLLSLFKEKYPDSPQYDNVPCDFNQAIFDSKN
jgi:hypothetical protein